MSNTEEINENEIKKTIDEIIEKSKKIDTKAIAEEVLTWIKNNVENFIDNHERIFKMDLHLPYYVEEMKNAYELQELFKAIPDDTKSVSVDVEGKFDVNSIDKHLAQSAVSGLQEEAVHSDIIMNYIINCRNTLNEKVDEVLKHIQENEELKKEIFVKMSYYYEIQGISNGTLIKKNIQGLVEITEFNYDAFTMGVSITPKEIRDEKGNIIKEAGDVVKYTIPESFSLVLEISFKDKTDYMASMF